MTISSLLLFSVMALTITVEKGVGFEIHIHLKMTIASQISPTSNLKEGVTPFYSAENICLSLGGQTVHQNG